MRHGELVAEMTKSGQRNTVRAFLAVELASEIHARLAGLKAELARLHARVRWVSDEALHATVKFLGSTRTDLVDALRIGIASALAGQSAVAVRARGVGGFPSAKRPRVVWAGLECEGLST